MGESPDYELPDPPPQLKELAERRGYWLQSGVVAGEVAWWLLWWDRDPELKPQLEKLGMRPFSPFTPDYVSMVFRDHRGERYIYHPHYPPFYLGRATITLSVEVEKNIQQRLKLYGEALTYYTDSGPKWQVQRERLSDLIAERNDLEQQIEREGEHLKVLLQNLMSIQEVLYAEYKRATDTKEINGAEGTDAHKTSRDLLREIFQLRTRFFQGSRDNVEAQHEKISGYLQDAGVPDFLIRHQWDGITDLLNARDTVMRPMFYMNKKRLICERLLNAARLDKPAPTWEEVKKELRPSGRRDTRAADKKLESAKKSVAVTLLVPADDATDEDFVLDPRWKGKSEKCFFEAVEKEDRYPRKWPAIKRQLTNNMESPPYGRGAEKWKPAAEAWATELSIPPFLFENRKT